MRIESADQETLMPALKPPRGFVLQPRVAARAATLGLRFDGNAFNPNGVAPSPRTEDECANRFFVENTRWM